jgi:hypothetical protein
LCLACGKRKITSQETGCFSRFSAVQPRFEGGQKNGLILEEGSPEKQLNYDGNPAREPSGLSGFIPTRALLSAPALSAAIGTFANLLVFPNFSIASPLKTITNNPPTAEKLAESLWPAA